MRMNRHLDLHLLFAIVLTTCSALLLIFTVLDVPASQAQPRCRPRNVPLARLSIEARKLPMCPTFKKPITQPSSRNLLGISGLFVGGGGDRFGAPLCEEANFISTEPVDFWISGYFGGSYVLNHPAPGYRLNTQGFRYCSSMPDPNIRYTWTTPSASFPLQPFAFFDVDEIPIPTPETTGVYTLTISSSGRKLTKTITVREFDGPRIRVYREDGADATNLEYYSSVYDIGRIAAGTPLTVSYRGFFQNETVEVGLYQKSTTVSDDFEEHYMTLIDAWEVQTDESGTYTETLLLPQDAPLGFYRLEACGEWNCTRYIIDNKEPIAEARSGFEVVTNPIAYFAGPTGQGDIYLIEPSGTNKRRLTGPNQTDEAEPDWSPDGQRIAYQSNADYTHLIAEESESFIADPKKIGDYNIWVTTEGMLEVVVDIEVDAREPDWSPDGNRLVFRAGGKANEEGDLMLYDFESKQSKWLGRTNLKGRSPVWSSDGKEIAFMSQRTGRWQIYIYDLDTGRERQVTKCPNHCRFPNWAPDGDSILFHSADSDFKPLVAWRAWLGTEEAERLFEGDQPGRPAEMKAGRIVYNGPEDLYVFDTTSGGRTKIPNARGGVGPDWSPVAISESLPLGVPVR